MTGSRVDRPGLPASDAATLIRARAALRDFVHTEAAGGAAMLVGVLVALVWANGFADSYHEVVEHRLHLALGPFDIDKSVHGWINEGLMTIFFFVVGLEIKREAVVGELRDPRTAALPIVAALGGMVAPALVYVAIVGSSGDAGRGWGVPIATDIAFAVGVLALLGPRAPTSLKLFLLTLAVADDVGGIVVIAAFYASDVSVPWLLAAAGTFAVVASAHRLGLTHPLAYVPLGVASWYCLVEAGVEPAIAGVVLGLLTPANPVAGRAVLEQLEHRVGPWSAYLIVPTFAVANAGVGLGPDAVSGAMGHPVTWGIALGLLAGKTIGITIATFLGVRFGVGRLGEGIRPVQVVGVAVLAGVGFTVSLFVASLAFEDAPDLLAHAKIGVFIGSATSAVIACVILVSASRGRRVPRYDECVTVDRDGDGWISGDEVEDQLGAAIAHPGGVGHHDDPARRG
jgi:Na+:H+ antiporter, NhaA family